jgi:hypothetical protein
MFFSPTEQSRAFGKQLIRNAALSGLVYGPFTLVFLLFSAWVKLGNTPLFPYGCGFAMALVLFLYYYNNIVRRGRLFTRIIDTVRVAEETLYYRTNPWLFTKPTEGTLALADVTLTRKTIMSVKLLEFSRGPGVPKGKKLYLIENSLVNEGALRAILAHGPKPQ